MKFKLDNSEYRVLANVCISFTPVFLASLIIPVFNASFDIDSWPVLLFGIGFIFGLIGLALYFGKKGKL